MGFVRNYTDEELSQIAFQLSELKAGDVEILNANSKDTRMALVAVIGPLAMALDCNTAILQAKINLLEKRLEVLEPKKTASEQIADCANKLKKENDNEI